MEDMDYKQTLNLPKTAFAMKANLAQREPQMQRLWAQDNLYQKVLATKNKDASFILNDGPPYANGEIHIGHALNKILKDIVIKSKLLSGNYAPNIPGWDCHGLPIEIQVEKKHGKAGVKIDKKQFRQLCREYAAKQVDIQRESFKRLGILADWDNPYITMESKFEADTIRVLAAIVKNQHIVKGEKPVHWCVDCASALADTEVEYMLKDSKQVDVAFNVVDSQAILQMFKSSISGAVSFIIWTTTPWTLPANEAVAINKELDYALVQCADRLIVVAKDLVDNLAQRYAQELVVVATLKGCALENTKLWHPFIEKQVPVILAEHVNLEAGTGCVHTAPAHGYDDFIVGQKYKLPVTNPVDANGCFYANIEFVANMHVFKANEQIIEVLLEHNNLLQQAKLEHSYPHCWRHKTPLIFRATSQWFISMEHNNLRTASLDAIKQVQWFPSWGQTRISKMLENRPDWCISRQRTWGTPLTLVIHHETGQLHPQSYELILQAASLVEQHGIDIWFDSSLQELYPKLDLKDYIKVEDVMDVWFDSGAVHYCVAKVRPEIEQEIVDLYLEGSDQHRGWFQTSLMSSVATKEHAPYKQVLTHGFTVDANGRKMSKSLGNVVAPDKVMKTLGADVLRLWVAATDYSGDLHVSQEILTRTSDAYRRIRNTARFLLANLHDFDPNLNMVPANKMLALDKWIVIQTKNLQTEVIENYKNYNFHVIYQKLHNFCSQELGSFYLDVIKDRQYTGKTDATPRRSAQTALYHVINSLVPLLAPILSFTAEEIWQQLQALGESKSSVFMTTWYENFPKFDDLEFENNFWKQIIYIRNIVNKELEVARSNGVIGSALEAEVTLYCDTSLYKILASLKCELRFVFITSKALLGKIEEAKHLVSTENPSLKLQVVKSKETKCERCWHRREDVNTVKKYPNICKRCVSNIEGQGETRQYA